MDAPYENHWQYGVKVNPLAAAKLIDDMLLEENVDIYYDQALVSVEYEKHNEKNHVTAILITTKDGLMRLTAKTFIDCTGDGDLCMGRLTVLLRRRRKSIATQQYAFIHLFVETAKSKQTFENGTISIQG